jgi:DNA-binding XRE family transcriptional regulator
LSDFLPFIMANIKLNNYLRTHRRRFGLSQSEMAFLLGSTRKARVSEYECLEVLPSLKTALAYEFIFGVPVSELFPGVFQQVEKETAKRARSLMEKLENNKSKRMTPRKTDFLRAVAITPEIIRENS